MFYKVKLATNNIKDNLKTYLPFIFTGVMTYILFSSINNLKANPSLGQFKGSNTLKIVLNIGLPVFLFFFLLMFINVSRFTFKLRSKSYGLYHVLGFSKNDISMVYLIETVGIFLISSIVGFIVSIGFDRILFWAYQEINQSELIIQVAFSLDALVQTLSSLLSLFLVSSLVVLYVIYKSNSMDLLKDSDVGEEPPSYNLIIALVGIILLIGTYYYASTIKRGFLSEENILTLLITILSAIIATYLIFTSSSVFILNKVIKSKRIFYRPKAMVILSNLYFRMKKNAFSLSSVTILATMAIFTFAVTSMLFVNLYRELPLPATDFTLKTYDNETLDLNGQLDLVGELDLVEYENLYYDEARLEIQYLNSHNLNEDIGSSMTTFMRLSDYNLLYSSKIILSDNQIILVALDYYQNQYDVRKIKMLDKIYTITKYDNRMFEDYIFDLATIVVVDDSEFTDLINKFSVDLTDNKRLTDVTYSHFNVVDSNKMRVSNDEYEAFVEGFSFETEIGYGLSFNRINQGNMRNTYSSLLLVGFIFIVIFILNLFITLYFKYYQEALEDRRQFKTLQNVGLSYGETKKTLTSQISLVYFLPLIFALFHIYFARNGLFVIGSMFEIIPPSYQGDVYYAHQNGSLIISIVGFSVLYLLMFFVIKKLAYGLVISKEEVQ